MYYSSTDSSIYSFVEHILLREAKETANSAPNRKEILKTKEEGESERERELAKMDANVLMLWHSQCEMKPNQQWQYGIVATVMETSIFPATHQTLCNSKN